MKKPLQQLNLYHPMFQKQEVPFAATTIAVILAVLIGAYGVTYGVTWVQLQGLEGQLEAAQERRTKIESNMEIFSSQSPDTTEDRGLLQRLEDLQRQRDIKKEGLLILEGSMAEERVEFSSFFIGLARQNIDGLWLQRIYVRNGGDELELGGGVTYPEMVPQLLGKLSQEDVFKGHLFQVLNLQRGKQEQPFISFSLSTTSKKEQPE